MNGDLPPVPRPPIPSGPSAPAPGPSGPAPAPAPAPATTEDNVAIALPNPSALEVLATEFPEELDNNISEKYIDPKYNAWYPLLESFVSTLSDECLRHSTMHAESSKLYNKRYQYITISLIIIPLFSGVIALLPVGLTVSKISQGFLALILAVIAGINKTMRFQERSTLHRLASDKYMKLNSSISEQLLLPFEKRYNGIYFERWCRGIFFSIKSISPYPDKRFSKQLQVQSKDTPSTPSPSQPIPGGPTAPIPGPIPVPLPGPGGDGGENGQPPTETIPIDAFPEQTREEAYRKYLQGRGRRKGVFM